MNRVLLFCYLLLIMFRHKESWDAPLLLEVQTIIENQTAFITAAWPEICDLFPLNSDLTIAIN